MQTLGGNHFWKPSSLGNMIHRDEGETVEIKREELTKRGGKEREREGWEKKEKREKKGLDWMDGSANGGGKSWNGNEMR